MAEPGMGPEETPSRVAYLDRDGTINIDRHYLSDPAGFAFLPNAVAGLKRLRDLGFSLVVITNQSGIGRGMFDEARLAEIHTRMIDLLAAEGLTLDAIQYCPHAPDAGCDCRKPLPGMIRQAEARLGRRPGVMIGDSAGDIGAGRAAGMATLRIGDPADPKAHDPEPDAIVADLVEAADWLATHPLPPV